MGDLELLERCLGHDREAWAAFVGRFSKLIYSVVCETLRRHGVIDGSGLVDELHNGTFLALYDQNYRRLRQWSGRCSLASWVRLVAASTTVDHLRRRRPEVPIPDDATADDALAALGASSGSPDNAETLLLRAEAIASVSRALATLSESDRSLLLRLFADEVQPEVLAGELGIHPGALYTRKNRALNRLRAALGPQKPPVPAVRSAAVPRPLAQAPRRAIG